MNEITIPDNLTWTDSTHFWLDDGYVFTRIESSHEPGTGNRHDLEEIIALRDWLSAVIKELEGET